MLEMDNKQKIAVLVLAAFILFGAGFKYALMQKEKLLPAEVLEQGPREVEGSGGEPRDIAPQEIVVHVAGAVASPGVYRLPEGSRAVDAVDAAGAAVDARLDLINLAAPLVDGQKIQVPGESDLSSTAGAGLSSGVSGEWGGSPALVNINTADQAQLETLPGIGPSMAGRIIQYRETSGPYRSTEDIKNVSGIGEKRYEQLKDLISVH
ncbi:MAG: ComEA family DNA-binding protein [Bacillota bacterium]